MTTEAAAAYREARGRISAMLRHAGARAEEREVPAYPGWTPKDVISHLTGVCADVLAGRLDGVGTALWTAVQVEQRRSCTVDELIDEWADAGSQVEALLPNFPQWAVDQILFDLIRHEHDIAEALGLPIPDKGQPKGVESGDSMLCETPIAS